MGFPGGVVKNLPANAGDTGLILGQEEEMATHTQYSFLGNPMDRGTWKATIHGVTKSWTQLSTRLHFNRKGPGYHPGHGTKTP